jgi:dienelactone hydrolase
MTIAVLLLLAVPAAETDSLEARARAFVTHLEKGEYDAAGQGFDAAMAKALPPDKVKAMWEGLVKQVGPLQKQEAAREETAGPYTFVFLRCKFEKTPLEVKVVFDKDRKITGLNILPANDADRYPPPAYAKKDAFTESAVKVGAGEWVLPGTLTLPRGDGPFPAVVLVHGSGAQDRDETIGRLKPFRDIAWGLAAKGVAVLRYEKRTKEHPLKFAAAKNLTVADETIDDALAAAALLRITAKIDPNRVFILGHSQGGMLAPQMALTDKTLAGIILMAGPSRPLEDVILEQTERGLADKSSKPEFEVKILETLRAVASKAKAGMLTSDTPSADLMGMSATYWLSLLGYRPTVDAAKLTLPILILQGEADGQVTMADFDGWKKALAGRKNVAFKSYQKLSHHFTPSDGKGSASEFSRPANVPEVVVNDIAAWIAKPGK